MRKSFVQIFFIFLMQLFLLTSQVFSLSLSSGVQNNSLLPVAEKKIELCLYEEYNSKKVDDRILFTEDGRKIQFFNHEQEGWLGFVMVGKNEVEAVVRNITDPHSLLTQRMVGYNIKDFCVYLLKDDNELKAFIGLKGLDGGGRKANEKYEKLKNAMNAAMINDNYNTALQYANQAKKLCVVMKLKNLVFFSTHRFTIIYNSDKSLPETKILVQIRSKQNNYS